MSALPFMIAGWRGRTMAALCGLLLTCTSGATTMLPSSMRHFAMLEDARVQYQALARNPSLTRLPPLPQRAILPGEAYAGAQALRNLLIAVGDMPRITASDPVDMMDTATVTALRRFQERHGLTQDGVLGPATWRALTTPLAMRLRQIELTLDRWRSLPANPHQRAIFINIPRFRLYAMDSASDSEAAWLQMDVVVGRNVDTLRTPVFTADLTHLIFRPYWEVPRSITLKELIPAARRNPDYFERNDFELVDGGGRVVPYSTERLAELASGHLRVRQRPGEQNALGGVKFMMPNANNVYLHDTPNHELFSRPVRAFSHGCIRVSAPAQLAQWLLGGDGAWTPERIAEAMHGETSLQVPLVEPVRVYIVYGTAIAREDGSVLFLDDLYGLDRR